MTSLKGLITTPSAAMDGAKAMRAFLAGRSTEAARILSESRDRSARSAAAYAASVTPFGVQTE